MTSTVRILLAAGVLTLGTTSSAVSQTVQMQIDPRSSLAWWQVNPHMEHLWASTCPGDPSWRPGEGRSLAWAADFLSKGKNTGHANQLTDSADIPRYPRRRVRAICTEAVTGQITVDTTTWRGGKGEVEVKADALVMGLDLRDNYARKSILTTAAYPMIRLFIDSLGPMTKATSARGDTLKTTVYGQFELRGVKEPVSASAKTTREAGGFRVRSKFMIPAKEMIETYGISKMALGLGVGQTLWEELWVGVDVLMKPAGQ